MNPERWRKVDAIFQAALDRAPEERAAYLVEACGTDDTLRREVEALLIADQKADSLIEIPAYAMAAPLLVESEASTIIGKNLSHYKILSLLGKGGMGEVYLAEDTKLHREVAIKILSTGVPWETDRLCRFEQEARAVSALNHPNIITVHEFGEFEGTHFLVTEHVAGETLRQRLARSPGLKLEPQEAVQVAMQIADALVAAHEAGVTHRDLKPENVMLRPDGLIKVLDFGLAKLNPLPDQEVLSQSTFTGIVVGTVRYMSPEQARGQNVDYRADIFSLGVMLYEMLEGRRPFEGATTSDVIAALLTKEPAMPVRLEPFFRKCLAKERESRFHSAKELGQELKSISIEQQSLQANIQTNGARFEIAQWMVIPAILIAVLSGLLWLFSRVGPAEQSNEIQSLAVLPLENLSGDPSQEFFADGMTEALINSLSKLRAARVISRTSVMRYKGKRQSLADIARELKVDAVIEGSVQRFGGRVKISARLMRAENENLLRAFEYERELADVLTLQNDVARAIAGEIRIQMTDRESNILAYSRRLTPEAYESYLLGRSYLRRQNEAELKLAIAHFERAIQLDANFAAAWAGLSISWLQRGLWGAKSFQEVEIPARKAAVRALELDAGSAEAYTSLAVIKNRYDWDWAGAEQDYKRAISLDPGNVETHRFYAGLLSALGRHDEMIREMSTAEQLDPLSSLVQSEFGSSLSRARMYERAEQRLKQAIERDALNSGAYRRLGLVYGETGRFDEAISSLEKAVALQKNSGAYRTFTINFALVYAWMGRRKEALQMLKELQQNNDPARFPAKDTAAVWTALGNYNEAFRLLFEAMEKHTDILIFLKVDPWFDDLHADPRWNELLRKMKLQEG